jgi:hypothetical protein
MAATTSKMTATIHAIDKSFHREPDCFIPRRQLEIHWFKGARNGQQ